VSAASLAVHCLELLGPPTGPVAVVASRTPRLAAALAARVTPSRDGDRPAAAIVAFLGAVAAPTERQRVLHALRTRLPAGAPLVLIDHNQPRALARRVLGWLVLAAAGLGPARARYPGARELRALGFTIDRLRLACGERVQLVLARRAA
jgi:hypothetical protein